MHKVYLNISEQKMKNPKEKWTKIMKRKMFTPKNEKQMAIKHMRKCSTSAVTRLMQIKTIMGKHAHS